MPATGPSRSCGIGLTVLVFVLLVSSVLYLRPLSSIQPFSTPPHEPDWAHASHDGEEPARKPQANVPYIQEEVKEIGEDTTHLLSPEQQAAAAKIVNSERLEIKSKITKNGEYLRVDFLGAHRGFNPSVIPHPYKTDPPTWLMIANKDLSQADMTYFNYQLVCEAEIRDDKMQCTKPPLTLPIASTSSHQCSQYGLDGANDVIGPHDARIFHGLEQPFVTWMTPSQYTCLGQYLQDARRLVPWDQYHAYTNDTADFFWPTELRRPPPIDGVEKNFFLFWAADGQAYIHHDIKSDHRVFAKLNTSDGVVGPDLAPLSAEKDSKCLTRLMPELNPETKLEFIHQATNSLLVTTCNRSDPQCQRTDDNTFIMTLFQKKSFYGHGMYEPYIMLFKQTAPFEVVGISSKSLWYNGRGRPEGEWQKDTWRPHGQTEMLFTTSMSWQSHDLTYHGHLDDVLFLTFGVEDKRGGILDVVVGDLIADLAYCD
ncbi:unnamed protein product [Zymoseptoria tritici ST99CH_1A5]|uniref:Uncharacterized protein n=2 Tax=Zymoseptoria tritici TaxID=1047171 RepID=A0A2H1H008_ZYMTR|nr:unnamed protein product [Zymoseptoria tritici ST99CH_1E4]SMY28346.1 unnamed protein product [Zymoseptoria tritici ST99CH_1A5]